ncbi:MAG: hypothetical protein ACRYFA_08415 [Janthinobacterium lividum]
MKKSNYFYTFLLLGILAVIIYGFLNYFFVMVGLIAFSSVFSFVVFLVQTRVDVSAINENSEEKPIDFYKVNTRTTYYVSEQRKQANAD